MIQIVYWGLELYSASVPEAKGAIDGLVAQSKALLLKEWRGCKSGAIFPLVRPCSLVV